MNPLVRFASLARPQKGLKRVLRGVDGEFAPVPPCRMGASEAMRVNSKNVG